MNWEFAHTHTKNPAFTLTVFAAAVQSGLYRAGGDVEEAIHEEESIRQEDVLRPLVHSREICEHTYFCYKSDGYVLDCFLAKYSKCPLHTWYIFACVCVCVRAQIISSQKLN